MEHSLGLHFQVRKDGTILLARFTVRCNNTHQFCVDTGKVVGGLDSGLVDADGNFDPEVVYLLQTTDGCNVLVRETGHAPNVFLLFETACDKYDWLNDVVAYGLAAQVTGGISVEVFQVSSKYGESGLSKCGVANSFFFFLGWRIRGLEHVNNQPGRV